MMDFVGPVGGKEEGAGDPQKAQVGRVEGKPEAGEPGQEHCDGIEIEQGQHGEGGEEEGIPRQGLGGTAVQQGQQAPGGAAGGAGAAGYGVKGTRGQRQPGSDPGKTAAESGARRAEGEQFGIRLPGKVAAEGGFHWLSIGRRLS